MEGQALPFHLKPRSAGPDRLIRGPISWTARAAGRSVESGLMAQQRAAPKRRRALDDGPPVDPKIQKLLHAARGGDSDAVSELIPLLYDELRALARSQRARWHGDVSLNTTALLHEAYVKMAVQESPDWRDRSHFMAVACTAMRQVLIDHARRRQAKKRGGGAPNVTFDDIEKLLAASDPRTDTEDDALLLLDDCLHRLADRSPRQARVVECRFFGGLTIPETSEALDVSPATVKRDWAMAQAWLHQEIQVQPEASNRRPTA